VLSSLEEDLAYGKIDPAEEDYAEVIFCISGTFTAHPLSKSLGFLQIGVRFAVLDTASTTGLRKIQILIKIPRMGLQTLVFPQAVRLSSEASKTVI
jgi:hypothetical protein